MKISDNARRFADRHVGRNCLDNSCSQDKWDWYYRLYMRFVSYDLDKALCSGVKESAFGLRELIENRAEDWLCFHRDYHRERGGACISWENMKKLYVEVISEIL